MQVAGHMHAVRRGFECRAMPAYEKPPALPEDNYYEFLILIVFQYIFVILLSFIVFLITFCCSFKKTKKNKNKTKHSVKKFQADIKKNKLCCFEGHE